MIYVTYDAVTGQFEQGELSTYDTHGFLTMAYRFINCQLLERAFINSELVAWVDEEGVYRQFSLSFVSTVHGVVRLSGSIILTGGDTRTGYSKSVPEKYLENDFQELRSLIRSYR